MQTTHSFLTEEFLVPDHLYLKTAIEHEQDYSAPHFEQVYAKMRQQTHISDLKLYWEVEGMSIKVEPAHVYQTLALLTNLTRLELMVPDLTLYLMPFDFYLPHLHHLMYWQTFDDSSIIQQLHSTQSTSLTPLESTNKPRKWEKSLPALRTLELDGVSPGQLRLLAPCWPSSLTSLHIPICTFEWTLQIHQPQIFPICETQIPIADAIQPDLCRLLHLSTQTLPESFLKHPQFIQNLPRMPDLEVFPFTQFTNALLTCLQPLGNESLRFKRLNIQDLGVSPDHYETALDFIGHHTCFTHLGLCYTLNRSEFYTAILRRVSWLPITHMAITFPQFNLADVEALATGFGQLKHIAITHCEVSKLSAFAALFQNTTQLTQLVMFQSRSLLPMEVDEVVTFLEALPTSLLTLNLAIVGPAETSVVKHVEKVFQRTQIHRANISGLPWLADCSDVGTHLQAFQSEMKDLCVTQCGRNRIRHRLLSSYM